MEEDTKLRNLSDITKRLCRCIPCEDCPWYKPAIKYTLRQKHDGIADECNKEFTEWLRAEVRGEHDNARLKQCAERS